MTGVLVWSTWSNSATAAQFLDPPDRAAVAQQADEPPDQPPAERSRRGCPGADEDDDRAGWLRGEKLRGRGRGLRDGRLPPPPPEMIEQAMETIREKLPEYHQEMEKLRGADPQRFERAMTIVMPVVSEYLDLRDRDQKLADTIIEEFKIEWELRKLSAEYKKAVGDSQKQASMEETLQRLVREQFDLRMQRQESRLQEFERRLEKQRQQLDRERGRLEEQRANLAELVNKRVEEVKAGKLRDRFRSPGHGPGSLGRPGSPPSCPGGPGMVGPPPDLGHEGPPPPPPRTRHRDPRGPANDREGEQEGHHPPPDDQGDETP